MDTGFQRGDIRVSDADRDQAVAELGEAFQTGRLTQEEFEERSDRAFQARTGHDLSQLLADLPRQPAAPVSPDAPASGGSGAHPWLAGRVVIALVIAVIVLGSVFSHRHGAEGFGWLVPVVVLWFVLGRVFRHRR
jgi:Domain of unknown function (DUF1707)